MSDRGAPEHGLFEELKALTDASLCGEITKAQSDRLEHLLREPASQDLYLELMWESHILATWAKSAEQEQFAEAPVKSIPRRAVRSPAQGFFRRATRPMRRYRGDPRFALAVVWISTLLFAGLVAGVVAAITVMFRGANVPGDQQIAEQGPAQPSLPTTPVARLYRAVNCIWSGEISSPSVGDDLVAGRKLILKAGLAEVVFRNGAHAIVEGPAIFEARSRASGELIRGKCAVTADDALAHGFVLQAPGMRYTDFGTEFGVLVAESGEQELHVFRGKVWAEEAVKDRPAATGDRRNSRPHAPRSMLLAANEAMRVESPGMPIERIASDEKRFVRAILDPFSVFGTGVGLDRGAPDPHWEITRISTDANFKPQPAVVVVPDRIYARDNRDTGQWIASSQPAHDQPPGCRWTLRTQFDLTGFDPSSARIEGQLSADNYVVDIRVNGKAVPIPPGNRDDKLLEGWLPLRIDDGFVSGMNTLEIVIENGSGTEPGRPQPTATPMALCVEMKGSAQKSANLKAETGGR
jgi:hypothetical protein